MRELGQKRTQWKHKAIFTQGKVKGTFQVARNSLPSAGVSGERLLTGFGHGHSQSWSHGRMKKWGGIWTRVQPMNNTAKFTQSWSCGPWCSLLLAWAWSIFHDSPWIVWCRNHTNFLLLKVSFLERERERGRIYTSRIQEASITVFPHVCHR